MTFTIILAAALAAQVPTAEHKGPKTDAELRAMMAKINARYSTPEYLAQQRLAKQRSRAAFDKRWEAERPARIAAAAADRAYREARREAAIKAQAAAEKKAQDDYRAMLPYMLEQQRQQLQRMSEIERNQALHRMAAAQEYEAQTNKERADRLAWWLMQQRPR